MEEKFVELRIALKAIKYAEETVKLSLKKRNWYEIDAFTMQYPNKEILFLENREDINKCIQKKYENSLLPFLPSEEIELSGHGVYIQEVHAPFTEHAPLFQKTKISGVEYPTIEVVKKKLFEGRIYDLYAADLENQRNEQYESIFQNCHFQNQEDLQRRIAKMPEWLNYFLTPLEQERYYYTILRFALSKSKPRKLDIISRKKEKPKEEDVPGVLSGYRPPYND